MKREMSMNFGVMESPVDERTYVFENLNLTCGLSTKKQYMLKTIESMSQGYTNWCVAFASSNMAYCDALAKFGSAKRMSQGFIMKFCKDLDGYKNATGTTLDAAVKVLTKAGVCEYFYYPFKGDAADIKNQFKTVTNQMLENAARYKAASYARCSGIDGIKIAIENANGVIICLNIFSNYNTSRYGVIELPPYMENPRGRHCVFACGWDDEIEIQTATGRLKGAIIIQESDDLASTSKGFRYLPYKAFSTYTRMGDRVFQEAWCTYEKDLLAPDIHRDAEEKTPGLKQRTITMQLGSKILKYEENQINMDIEPQVKNSVTLLPLRYLVQALEMNIIWNNTKKYAKAYDQERGITRIFKLNDNKVYDVSDRVVLTGLTNTQIISGRVMLPVRIFAESFGATVDYEKETKIITVRL